MSPDAIREKALEALGEIAPEADLGTIDPDSPIRDQLDIDSVDLLNFVVALEAIFGVTVPEGDYREIATVRGLVDYLTARVGTETP